MADILPHHIAFIREHCGKDMTVLEAARYLGISGLNAQMAADVIDGANVRPTGFCQPCGCRIAPGIRASWKDRYRIKASYE